MAYSGVPNKHAAHLFILETFFPSNTALLGATCLLNFRKFSHQLVYLERLFREISLRHLYAIAF